MSGSGEGKLFAPGNGSTISEVLTCSSAAAMRLRAGGRMIRSGCAARDGIGRDRTAYSREISRCKNHFHKSK